MFEWMVQQTAETTLPTKEQAQRLLARKKHQIADLNALVVDRRFCFRDGLLDYLVGTQRQRPRQSLARRLLSWVFGERLRVARAPFCCDACDPKKARLALERAGLTLV